jgi:hypothetical protein
MANDLRYAHSVVWAMMFKAHSFLATRLIT